MKALKSSNTEDKNNLGKSSLINVVLTSQRQTEIFYLQCFRHDLGVNDPKAFFFLFFFCPETRKKRLGVARRPRRAESRGAEHSEYGFMKHRFLFGLLRLVEKYWWAGRRGQRKGTLILQVGAAVRMRMCEN
jgi:hypothetical protein